jgi:diguanylate cyclase (GGDEF)-like protein
MMTTSQGLADENSVMPEPLKKLILMSRRIQKRQRIFILSILLVFSSLVGLTIFSIGSWQQHLLDRSRLRTQEAATRLAESFSSNLSAMIQMHMRDLQFMTSLPTGELSPDLLRRFNNMHPWLSGVACRSADASHKSPLAVDYPLDFNMLLSDGVNTWKGGVDRPFVDKKGLLHIPLRIFALSAQLTGKHFYRICQADLFFGNQHASASPEHAHMLLLLDGQHHVLAQWMNGHWQQAGDIPEAWTAHLEIPVRGTPWAMQVRWNSQPLPDLQHLLDRLDIWTVLLLAAESGLALVALIWMYRRFVESRYQRAHQALHEMVNEAQDVDEIYQGLVQLSVLGTGALAAYVAVPDEKQGILSVVAASARKPGLAGTLRQLPLSLDPENLPWGQLLPSLAYRLQCRVTPRTPHISGMMTKAMAAYPPLRGFREVIAWPVMAARSPFPVAIFVLEITRLTRWLFGRSLIVHWESLLHDLESYKEKIQAIKEKERLLQTDALTGLPNRSHFTTLVTNSLNTVSEAQSLFGLALLDMDMFNEINTSFSSLEADQCLQEIACQLQGVLPQSDDILARVGGDEFGLFIKLNDADHAISIGEEILKAVQNSARKMLDSTLSTSIGWAMFPADGQDVYTLMAQADEALAEAKRQGGNTFKFFGGEVSRRAKQRLWVRRDFPCALQKGDIHFFLQPKADMLEDCLTGVEMLARWCPAHAHWIGPGKFMPYVEENAHLVRMLGCWALEEAARLGKRMRSEGLELQISLNIGAKHFLDPAFMQDIEQLCPDGNGLTLEITETASVIGRKSARPVMEWCQMRGFKLSMDDFGTGYSSLLSVARLRFNELKLDQSFIRAFREDIASFGVAGASHLLSQLTDCDLVAEGISTPDELHLWLQLGGRYIQGYLLSPPLPENAFFTWRDCLIPPVLRSVRTVGLQDMAGLWQEIHA